MRVWGGGDPDSFRSCVGCFSGVYAESRKFAVGSPANFGFVCIFESNDFVSI